MASLFQEFSAVYEQFRKRLPKHPLNEQLRVQILRGVFPSNDWMRSQTNRMRDLMAPVWARREDGQSGCRGQDAA
jgi:hypothetical protein